MTAPYLHTFARPGMVLQHTFDAAVVMPTLLRPEIATALRSIFAQDLPGRIHVVVGVDQPGSLAPVEAACAEMPENCAVQVFWPGYSTSSRHGGVSPARDGGSLRSILTYLANALYVAYLDDDNTWRPDHLSSLYRLMPQADWAFSLRWFCHPETDRPIRVDEWESVGPGKGVFQQRFGGFVDPNCLMLNKVVCENAIGMWNQPLAGDPTGMTADRSVFAMLRDQYRGMGSGLPTSFYRMNAKDGLHAVRVAQLGDAYNLAGLVA